MDRQSERVAEFTRRRNNRNKLYRLIAVMGLLVVAFTAFMLIRPAITMEGQAKILNCQYTVHQHDDSCYKENTDGEKELVCGKADYVIHEHEESCYDGSGKLICPLNAVSPEEAELHTHTEDCYEESGDLTCGKTEVLAHTHGDECFETADSTQTASEEFTLTAKTDSGITVTVTGPADALPYPADEVTVTVEEITDEESEDIRDKALKEDNLKAAENYLFDVCLWHDGEEIEPTSELTLSFSGLPLENGNKTVVYHIDKAKKDAVNMDAVTDDKDNVVLDTDHFSTYSVSLLAASGNNSVTVYQVNSYNSSSGNTNTILIHGGSANKFISGMSFLNWYAVIVEKGDNGYYVSQYIIDSESKASYSATSSDGFVLLIFKTEANNVDINVGDSVSVDFNYNIVGPYKSAGYGTVTFGSSAAQKPDKDNSEKLTVVPGADTRDLIEVNLYDYGSNINALYKSNTNYPGFQQEYGSRNVGDTFSKWSSFNFGNNITSDLAAGTPNVTNNGGDINATENGANSPISGAMKTEMGNDGYPALMDGTSLGYLFSNSTYATKKNSRSINGLFKYNEDTGAYTFNSRENHAQFNQGVDTFTLYQEIFTPNFMMYPFGNFLPFNDIVHDSAQTSTISKAYLEQIASSAQYKNNKGAGTEYGTLATQLRKFIDLMDNAYPDGWVSSDAMNEYFKASGIPKTFNQNEEHLRNLYSLDYDVPTDFFFGMDMHMNFMQPKGGLTGKDGKQPMVFYFTGDDDVWVYLDNKLALDLSGIHRHVGGEIDFVKGEIKYYSLDIKTGDVSETPYKIVPFKNIFGETALNSNGTFEDYSTHKFDFYYMERGAGSGVCRMNFNFPLLKKNSISVMKEVSVDEGNIDNLLGEPDYKFQILNNEGNIFIAENTSYDIYDTAGNKIGSGKVGPNGIFTLKANQTARFNDIAENAGNYYVRELLDPDAFSQYGTISVDGRAITESDNVVISNTEFKGVNSPSMNIADGNTIFRFNNKITLKKTGNLTINKVLNSQTNDDSQEFEFKITLDNKLLPKGTTYKVGTEIKTVADNGIIKLKAGETAELKNIIAGTAFKVEEINSDNYTVSYSGSEGVATDGSSASGVIKTGAAVEVTMINSEHATSVDIPINKLLEQPNGNEYKFKFKLEEVQDSNGTSMEAGVKQTTEIAIDKKNPARGVFTLTYLEKNYTVSSEKKHYYKITEVNDGNSLIKYNDSAYIVEITVTRTPEGINSKITNVYKNGEKVDSSISIDNAIYFNNIQLYSLAISKEITGTDTPETDKEFEFSISINNENGDPLTGTYNAVKNNGETVTIELDETGPVKDKIVLSHSQSITINGLPKGATCTVSEDEKSSSGYIVKYRIGDSDTKEGREASITLGPDNANNIEFINEAAYALPETGGIGTLPFTIAGIILILGAGAILYRTRLRRRED